MVYKKVTLIGRSTEGFEEAIEDAVDRATETLNGVSWVEVQSQGVEIASVDEPEYQAEVEVAFELQE